MKCRIHTCHDEAVSVVTVPSARGDIDCAYCPPHTLGALRAGATMTDREPGDVVPGPSVITYPLAVLGDLLEPANTPTQETPMPAANPPKCQVSGCNNAVRGAKVGPCKTCLWRAHALWGTWTPTAEQVAALPGAWAQRVATRRYGPVSAPVIGTATGTDAGADRAESVAEVKGPAPFTLDSAAPHLRSLLRLSEGSSLLEIVHAVETVVGERDDCREQLAVSERHRLATIADREQALNERDEARAMITPASSDELAALRKQVAELSFGASSWHKAHAAGQSMAGDAHDARARSTVAILLDGLESVCDDDLERATVRAIRAALGLDGVLPVK